MGETLIKVEGLSKKFCRSLKKSMWYGMKDIGSELLGRRHGADGVLRQDEFWAVKDINFELKRGECLGLIGHNGAGKTTLLRMLNGLIKPDQGRIEMRGKVGALIALGAGFNPILTGRENIYVNAALLGMNKQYVDNKIDEIIDFAEIRDSIDAPVQSYSSGMNVRLGFAIAAVLIEPDILIVDEVLAVGDAGFVLKCLNWIDNVLENTALIFVSHSMPMVSRICSSIMLIDKGRVDYLGQDVGTGIERYFGSFEDGEAEVTFNINDSCRLLEVSILGAGLERIPSIKRLANLDVKFVFEVDTRIQNPVISLFILDSERRPIAVCINSELGENSSTTTTGTQKKYEVFLRLSRIQFASGTYNVTFGLSEQLHSKPLFRVRNAFKFSVVSGRTLWQPFELEGEWSKKLAEGRP
ncbi:MAG: ATP-binding cassette domain-containing protein [Gammaproteobacteria bacterium]|nr:ATP-binding cassette domain-containing protein [Gammaproteobacteria bacterium]